MEENNAHHGLTTLLENLRTLNDHQSYMKTRFDDHRHIAEKTNTKIYKWTIFEGVCLVTVACAQIFALMKFFEKRRRL